jgi:hypothetical protein
VQKPPNVNVKYTDSVSDWSRNFPAANRKGVQTETSSAWYMGQLWSSVFHNIPSLQIKEAKLVKYNKAFQWLQQHHLGGCGYLVTDFTQ